MEKSREMNGKLAVVILAAGKGTRMKSDHPKVLHKLAGKPLLAYSLELARGLDAHKVVVVVGHQADRVKQAFKDWKGVSYAIQEPQLGTGHAVMAAARELDGFQGPVLILCGDVPGLRRDTLSNLMKKHRYQENKLTVLGMELEDPGAYGRLVVNKGGRLEKIVEYRDATDQEKRINLVNAGIYAAESADLFDGLARLGNQNDQKEYYLTDLVEIINNMGMKVGYDICPDPDEVSGINSKEELARMEEEFKIRKKRS